ncbi:probable DNA-directed RNA polymerases I and III subunit RPAC2 [Leptopilina boulardi]|uniref:probable DNA-directed RNA polymerases I and III subunit RPAC2 n=1 Tax=Leptopilina boulardi TaxID=63433 RepID=UPI0021F59DD9|nr:probable DNA-directed RNA polymerases I and III subunit RPAC2 [Leptopilina boulardi]
MAGRLAVVGGDDLNEKSKTFVFIGEGHTLGRALVTIMQNFADVMYCSYTISHPNEDKMMVRIQAREGRAVDILRRGLENLNDVCDHTIDTFEQAMKDFREST